MEADLSRPFYCDILVSDFSIPDGFALVSKNGQYAAVMQTDGNFVLYKLPAVKALWASGTNGKGIAPYSLKVLHEGNLALYDARKFMIWSSGASKGTSPYTLLMQDDGNLVLRDSNNRIFWATWTKQT